MNKSIIMNILRHTVSAIFVYDISSTMSSSGKPGSTFIIKFTLNPGDHYIYMCDHSRHRCHLTPGSGKYPLQSSHQFRFADGWLLGSAIPG